MKVRVSFRDGSVEEFSDVVEVHWRYPSPHGRRVAIERQDDGYTYSCVDVTEMEILKEGEV